MNAIQAALRRGGAKEPRMLRVFVDSGDDGDATVNADGRTVNSSGIRTLGGETVTVNDHHIALQFDGQESFVWKPSVWKSR